MLARLHILGLFWCLSVAHAQEVLRVTWPTSHAAPPSIFPKPASDFLPIFRAALPLLSESNVVQLALSQPAFLGIPTEDARRLQQLIGERYQLIQTDPVFRNVASALPYCYSGQTPTQGLALVYRPQRYDTNTPCLVFLHGYGGSFLWSQQLLAEAFPDYLIVCPVYGVSSGTMPAAYLRECLDAVRKQLRQPIVKPVLSGLSAGGFGADRIFTWMPDQFSQLVVIAAYPPEETLGRFDKKMSVRFLVGAKEDYVRSGAFARSMELLQRRTAKLDVRIIPDADHYFLLTDRTEALNTLHSWLETTTAPATGVQQPQPERP